MSTTSTTASARTYEWGIESSAEVEAGCLASRAAATGTRPYCRQRIAR